MTLCALPATRLRAPLPPFALVVPLQIRGDYANANEWCPGVPNFHRLFSSATNWTAADAKPEYRAAAPPSKHMIIDGTAALFNLCDRLPADSTDPNCNGAFGAPPTELAVGCCTGIRLNRVPKPIRGHVSVLCNKHYIEPSLPPIACTDPCAVLRPALACSLACPAD